MKKTLATIALVLTATTAQAETFLEKMSKPYETLPETHKVCFDKKDAELRPEVYGQFVILKASGKFGTDTDGEHWVGNNTYWFNKVTLKLTKEFNSVKYCG